MIRVPAPIQRTAQYASFDIGAYTGDTTTTPTKTTKTELDPKYYDTLIEYLKNCDSSFDELLVNTNDDINIIEMHKYLLLSKEYLILNKDSFDINEFQKSHPLIYEFVYNDEKNKINEKEKRKNKENKQIKKEIANCLDPPINTRDDQHQQYINVLNNYANEISSRKYVVHEAHKDNEAHEDNESHEDNEDHEAHKDNEVHKDNEAKKTSLLSEIYNDFKNQNLHKISYTYEEIISTIDKLLSVFRPIESFTINTYSEYIILLKEQTKNAFFDYCDTLKYFNKINSIYKNLISFTESFNNLRESISDNKIPLSIENQTLPLPSPLPLPILDNKISMELENAINNYIVSLKVIFDYQLSIVTEMLCIDDYKLTLSRQRLIYDYFNKLLKETLDTFDNKNTKDGNCIICCEIKQLVVLSTCGHVTCKECIDRISIDEWDTKCPTCRTKFNKDNIIPIYL